MSFLVGVSLVHIRFARVLFKRQLAAKGIDQELSGRAQNMLSGIITLKVFRLIEPVVANWIEKYRPRWVLEIAIKMIEITLGSIAIHAQVIFTFVILFVGLSRATSISASLGQVFAFLVVYSRMAQPFQFFVAFYLNFQETKASITRHYRLFDLASDVAVARRPARAPTTGEEKRPSPPRVLELRSAATVRGQGAVRIPDMRVEAGRAYLLEGPNGVGKTTTGLVLSGLLPITKGFYRRDESPIVIPYEASRIMYLEKDGYWPEGTIAENCRLSDPAGELDEERLLRCLELCKCDDLVASLPLGIHNSIASDWKLLSDGESQRLFVAFAMYHEPDVLILDEALTHVPFEVRRGIIENIRRARPGMIVILISHHEHDRDLVDQVIHLPDQTSHGRLRMGSPGFSIGDARRVPDPTTR
jgi:ABC-type bacteriocin/lantibiotic exporter with double-glycine peptidase domain